MPKREIRGIQMHYRIVTENVQENVWTKREEFVYKLRPAGNGVKEIDKSFVKIV